jgi:metal-responsive CopG/Arc/MetJ family transcriptional regulator
LVLKKGASKKIAQLAKKLEQITGVDVMKYCGKLQLKQDALEIQKV